MQILCCSSTRSLGGKDNELTHSDGLGSSRAQTREVLPYADALGMIAVWLVWGSWSPPGRTGPPRVDHATILTKRRTFNESERKIPLGTLLIVNYVLSVFSPTLTRTFVWFPEDIHQSLYEPLRLVHFPIATTHLG